MVKIADGSDTVAEYEYDGAKRRVIKKNYTGGTLDETRHLYYTEPSKWQVVEERVEVSTDAERHFVWGLRYVDDLVLRDRDTTADGSFDERLYTLHDANWNISGVGDSTGAVQERYAYTAYGMPRFLDSLFLPRATSSFQFETLFAGYRFDIEAGIYNVRNRTLHSMLGIWFQRDPLGFGDGVNLYQYCLGNPYTTVDPTGLASYPREGWYETEFCSFMLSDCVGNAISCLCGVSDWAGAVPDFTLSVLNCICEAWDFLVSICKCSVGLTSFALLQGVVDCVLGFLPGPIAILASLITDMIETIVDAVSYEDSGVPPDLVSCGFLVRDCRPFN